MIMKVHFGESVMEYPSDEFGQLTDSSSLVGDPRALRERMERDGYLFLPGLIEPEKVLTARERILDYMAQNEALVPGIHSFPTRRSSDHRKSVV